MSYTDLRDFEPEFATTTDGYDVQIEKLGGGTVGTAYTGTWRYKVSRDGAVVASGQDYDCGTPRTHSEAAAEIIELVTESSD